MHLSNDAAWCDAFSLRLQPPRELKAGDRIEDMFTVSVKGRALTYTADLKTYAVEGGGWVPLKMLKGVRPGGATDFSGWRLQDAPAGKYGWLKRAGGHFEFEGRPAGERVKFYGVNLVGSCCWPEKGQADVIVSLYLRGDAPDDSDFAKIDRAAKAMTVGTPRTQGGFGHAGCAFATSGMDMRLAGAHGAVWATSVDGKPLAESARILLTHLTDVQNTGVQWADADHHILLKRGGLPMRARKGTAEVSLKVASGAWKAYALGTDGARRCEVPVAWKGGTLSLTADIARDPKNATLLYELVR